MLPPFLLNLSPQLVLHTAFFSLDRSMYPGQTHVSLELKEVKWARGDSGASCLQTHFQICQEAVSVYN